MEYRPGFVTNISQLVAWLYTLPRKSFTKAKVISVIQQFFEHLVREQENVKVGLKFMAQIEPTSKLLNQKPFLEMVEAYLATEERSHCVAFLFLDVTRFKDINDTCGHNAGDNVLAAIGAAIRATRDYRPEYQVGERREHSEYNPFHVGTRIGDEFCLLIPNVKDSDECLSLARRLYKDISKIKIPEHPNVTVSVDIGAICVSLPLLPERFGVVPDPFTAVMRMKEWADSIMFGAKEYARTQVEPTINHHIARKFMRFPDLMNKSRQEKNSQTPAE